MSPQSLYGSAYFGSGDHHGSGLEGFGKSENRSTESGVYQPRITLVPFGLDEQFVHPDCPEKLLKISFLCPRGGISYPDDHKMFVSVLISRSRPWTMARETTRERR